MVKNSETGEKHSKMLKNRKKWPKQAKKIAQNNQK